MKQHRDPTYSALSGSLSFPCAMEQHRISPTPKELNLLPIPGQHTYSLRVPRHLMPGHVGLYRSLLEKKWQERAENYKYHSVKQRESLTLLPGKHKLLCGLWSMRGRMYGTQRPLDRKSVHRYHHA